jgi:hypothetical protein
MLNELTIASDDVRFRDRRAFEWAQAWGYHYSSEQLRSFATELVAQVPFATRIERVSRRVPPGTLVVNVRRGDYYSVPEFRARYGMNIVGWVNAAVPIALESTSLTQIQFVSDDLEWCRENLGHLEQILPTSFDRVGQGAQDDLATLTAADALVLANSTFSYWGGHLHGARWPGRSGKEVVVPRFHTRGLSTNSDSFHLDPVWSAVDAIPGGWDEERTTPDGAPHVDG